MQVQTTAAASMPMLQGATPPAWKGRSRLRLFLDVLGGWRQNWDKLRHLCAFLAALFRPSIVRRRLSRLHALGHIDLVPSLAQLLVGARDQMMVSATEETRIFYRAQGIPWVFHNLRRFIAGPATMLDPVGLFAPRDAIIHHVLQTFHRHPVYDLVLLRAYDGGVEEMAAQADTIVAGVHPHQPALASLIEDGSYHARLPEDIAAFRADPHIEARPVPPGLVPEAHLMLGMDQFKDLRGYTNYASRLKVSGFSALRAWLLVAFDETVGSVFHVKLGPSRVNIAACDPEIAARHLGPTSTAVRSSAQEPPLSL